MDYVESSDENEFKPEIVKEEVMSEASSTDLGGTVQELQNVALSTEVLKLTKKNEKLERRLRRREEEISVKLHTIAMLTSESNKEKKARMTAEEELEVVKKKLEEETYRRRALEMSWSAERRRVVELENQLAIAPIRPTPSPSPPSVCGTVDPTRTMGTRHPSADHDDEVICEGIPPKKRKRAAEPIEPVKKEEEE